MHAFTPSEDTYITEYYSSTAYIHILAITANINIGEIDDRIMDANNRKRKAPPT